MPASAAEPPLLLQLAEFHMATVYNTGRQIHFDDCVAIVKRDHPKWKRYQRAAPGQEQYYIPHNLREDKLVYNRDPREGTKAAWLRKLYDQHLAPFIKSVAPGWAGTYEDFAVQIAVYESSNNDYCHEHTDKDDVDVQYMGSCRPSIRLSAAPDTL